MIYPLDRTINVLSFGAGVQSSALLLMYVNGMFKDKLDLVVFADTQSEPNEVYIWLEKMKEICKRSGIKYIEGTRGNLMADTLSGKIKNGTFAIIPFFTKNQDGAASIGKRQCTFDYKIHVVHQAIRNELGYEPKKRVKHKVKMIMGISFDEMQRCKTSMVPWIENHFPLVFEQSIRRQQCVEYVKKHLSEKPPRSACLICPYKRNDEWRDLLDSSPDEFEAACDFDDKLRLLPKLKGQNYVHRSCVPLRDADLYEENKDQMGFSFLDECDGMCGI